MMILALVHHCIFIYSHLISIQIEEPDNQCKTQSGGMGKQENILRTEPSDMEKRFHWTVENGDTLLSTLININE